MGSLAPFFFLTFYMFMLLYSFKENNMNEELKTALSEGFVTVTFTKKDGTARTFDKATTNPALIPEEFHPKTGRKMTETSIRLFVDELQAWRSISVSGDNNEIIWISE